jgi:uncharacterized protein (UPF0332 family)
MIKFLTLVICVLSLQTCSAQNCSTLPDKFGSYEEATSKIAKATFKVSESVNTSKSSWIRSAKYKSCDGETGYFLFKTDVKEYIHKGVPISIWKGFKEAESIGSYYNRYIKRRYQLIPGQ